MQRKELDKQIKNEFSEMMLALKAERKAKKPLKTRELAKQLEITENYLSAIENGRVFPSTKLLLKYLLINQFNTDTLKKIKINNEFTESTFKIKRAAIIKKIFNLNESQIDFLLEQIKVSEIFRLKTKSQN